VVLAILKNMSSSMGRMTTHMENKTCLKPPTRLELSNGLKWLEALKHQHFGLYHQTLGCAKEHVVF
jgi:hypothetical protein